MCQQNDVRKKRMIKKGYEEIAMLMDNLRSSMRLMLIQGKMVGTNKQPSLVNYNVFQKEIKDDLPE